MTTLNGIFSDTLPVLSDRDLEAWGSYYCQEKRLQKAYTFDKFASDPVRHCKESGVFPIPHVGRVPEISEMDRNLLHRQRHAMWLADGFCSVRG